MANPPGCGVVTGKSGHNRVGLQSSRLQPALLRPTNNLRSANKLPHELATQTQTMITGHQAVHGHGPLHSGRRAPSKTAVRPGSGGPRVINPLTGNGHDQTHRSVFTKRRTILSWPQTVAEIVPRQVGYVGRMSSYYMYMTARQVSQTHHGGLVPR